MKVCLIGCVEFSEHALLKLIELESRKICEIAGVITKRESRFNSDFVDLGKTLTEAGGSEGKLHYYTNEASMLEFFDQVKPDVIYCFGWSNLLAQSVLDAAPKGVIGFHPAELPNNRGRHPIIWALALGLEKTASTFFRMDEGADSGPILSQETLPISVSDDARTLYDKIVKVAMSQIDTFTEQFAGNCERFQEQNHSLANYWRKRSAKDGLIDWRMHAQDIHNLVRALTAPYPGAEFESVSGQPVKVWQSSVEDELVQLNLEPGKVLDVQNNRVLVKCAENTAVWLEQTEPRLRVNAGEYL